MKFQISRSEYCLSYKTEEQIEEIKQGMLSEYPILNLFKIDIIRQNRRYELYIEINSLEELVELRASLCCDLMLYEDKNEDTLGIEIYDDLRE